MKKFIFKTIVFCAINVLAAIIVLAVVDSHYHFQQYETDSILLATPYNTEFGTVILGTSRARILTRVKCNWECLERELNMPVLNLAIPFGGGIVPEKLYLANFFRQGNRTKTILYFIDAFTLFSPQPNKQHRLVYYEPFRFAFLYDLMRNGFPLQRVFIYLQSKFTWRWFTQTPGGVPCDYETVKPPVDPDKVKKRVESLYFDGLNEVYFRKYVGVLGEILDMAKAHGCRVILALPPTLLGSQPGEMRLLEQLTVFRRNYDFEFYDFTDKIGEPELFGDYDHLNSRGVEVFAHTLLKPLFVR